MAQYKTPGVYVQEEDVFGSSIVANQTAVPLYVGFTEKAMQANGEPLAMVNDSVDTVTHVPVLVRSMLEYTQHFGGPDTTGTIEVTEKSSPQGSFFETNITKNQQAYKPGLLHPAMANYFGNGGGQCYVVSIGSFSDFNQSEPDRVNIPQIIEAIQLATNCTLILPTDLIRYNPSKYYNWCNRLIDNCQKSKQQFCVLDVIMTKPSETLNLNDINLYRTNVNSENLNYAAAYFPYLKSLTPYAYDINRVTLNGTRLPVFAERGYFFSGSIFTAQNQTESFIKFRYRNNSDQTPIVTFSEDDSASTISYQEDNNELKITLNQPEADEPISKATLNESWHEHLLRNASNFEIDFLQEFSKDTTQGDSTILLENSWQNEGQNDPENSLENDPFLVTRQGGVNAGQSPSVAYTVETEVTGTGSIVENDFVLTVTLPQNDIALDKALKWINNYIRDNQDSIIPYTFHTNPAYIKDNVEAGTTNMEVHITPDNSRVEQVISFLATNFINMPSSPYMAGIYSRIDNAEGVWTPPANVSPNGVRGPLVPITHEQQKNLNVDPVAGKSINAIRSFTGRGTLVWGARTNAGNNRDWRYINVRRLFIAMQTDISRSLDAFVFRPNVHNTWVEVRTMIDGYLFGLFSQGAFAGTTPETSYQVLIGEGETMTQDDILDGIMRATIRVAPVRPAEFIELTFSQMMSA